MSLIWKRRQIGSKVFGVAHCFSIEETDSTKKMFRKVQQHVEKMVEMFKRSKFFLSVAQKMSYDEGFTFNESNIVSYLAELEEYISSLITYTAFKRDDPNAAISAIPLEKLNQKDFNRKDLAVRILVDFTIPLQIDAPVAYELNQDNALPSEGGSISGNQEIISSKQLYKQFMKLVEGKGIHFVTQAQAKQQQNAIFK